METITQGPMVVKRVDDRGSALLCVAVQQRATVDLIKLLAKRNFSPRGAHCKQQKLRSGRLAQCVPLVIAAERQDTTTCEGLLALGAPVGESNAQNQTASMVAAEAGNPSLLKLFLEAGGNARQACFATQRGAAPWLEVSSPEARRRLTDYRAILAMVAPHCQPKDGVAEWIARCDETLQVHPDVVPTDPIERLVHEIFEELGGPTTGGIHLGDMSWEAVSHVMFYLQQTLGLPSDWPQEPFDDWTVADLITHASNGWDGTTLLVDGDGSFEASILDPHAMERFQNEL